MERNKIVPIIPYIGGKRFYLTKIQEIIPSYIENYFEPFCGACGFTLALYNEGCIQADNIRLNDASKDIINMYEVLRDNREEFFVLENMERTKKKFDKIKTKFNDKEYSSEIERAIYLCYLYNTSFVAKGLYQGEFKGIFNTRGRAGIDVKEFGKFNDKWNLNAFHFSLFLSHVQLSNLDYMKFLEDCEKGDFVFMDPPYDNNVYYDTGSDFDFQLLKIIFDKLTQKEVMVLLIVGDTPTMRRFFKDCLFIELQNRNNHFGDFKELVIYNYKRNGDIYSKEEILNQRLEKIVKNSEIPTVVDLEEQLEQVKLEKKKELKKYLKFRTYWIVISSVLIATQVYNLINFMINWTRIGNDLWHNQPEWAIGTAILLLMCCGSVITVFYYQNQITLLKKLLI